MSAQTLINTLADSARLAGRTLSVTTGAERREALVAIANAIQTRSAEILAANEKDMEAGRLAGLNSSLLDASPVLLEEPAKLATSQIHLELHYGNQLCQTELSWSKSQFPLVLLEWCMKHALM